MLSALEGQAWADPEAGEMARTIVKDGGVRSYIRRFGTIEK